MVPDVLVIGAGIFGLSVAYSARKAGLSVEILDAARPGAGASGGIVGALTPHAPNRWRAMKQFQFDALVSLPQHIAALEAQTGHSTGYAQTGRLTPLPRPTDRVRAEAEANAAPAVWGTAARFEILEDVPGAARGWLSPELAACGVVRDTLSARVDPRRYMKALCAAVGDDMICTETVTAIDPSRPQVTTNRGLRSARHIVLAAGWQGWELIGALRPDLQGSAVKGQAALLQANGEGLPVIYQDGLYIVPHASGQVAVGSTSEKVFETPVAPDDKLEAVLARARAAAPALAQAPVLERWAGLRPKPPGREPLIGPVPGHPGLWLSMGGFKISFGIAHLVGDALAAMLAGQTPHVPLPETFLPIAPIPGPPTP